MLTNEQKIQLAKILKEFKKQCSIEEKANRNITKFERFKRCLFK